MPRSFQCVGAGKYPEAVLPEINTNLVGLRCIGCGTDHPIDDYPLGCPDCRERGTAANRYCRYKKPTSGRVQLPITGATTLGEAGTPLFSPPYRLGLADVDVWIKDESANPTGSHKDRFSWSAVGRAAAAGYQGVAAASSGNAALSVAAYAAAYNLECDLAMTAGVSEAVVSSVRRTGANAHIFEHADKRWEYTARFARSSERLTITNNAKPVVGCSPFGIDGFKPLAWEIWNEWQKLPDHVVLPTSLDCSGGEAVVVGPRHTEVAQDTLARHGLLYEASSAVVLPAAADLRDREVISAGGSTVLVMTSHAFKGL